MSDLRPRTNRAPQRAAVARHGRLKKRGPFKLLLKIIAATAAVVLVSGVSISAIALAQLSGNIETVTLASDPEGAPLEAPTLGAFEGGFNMLIVGSDECVQKGGCRDRQEQLNDVTMLLHVSADQTSAVAVSFPRDLVVPIPECPRGEAEGGGTYGSMSAQPINNTLQYGGLACTVLTVEELTGLDVPYAGLITFNGVIGMSNAVGGVPVCIDGPINDRYSGFRRDEAGEYTLMGQDALNFLRTRHGVGDGSDLGRISSQQVFLSSLVRTVKSDDTLTNFPKLFGLATAATSNMKLSDSLAPLNTMVSMALVLKDVPLESITFVQYPGTTDVGGVYTGKVAPITAQADALFEKIATDEPFTLEAGTGRGSELKDPVASPPSATPEIPDVPVDPDAPVDPAAPSTAPEVDVLAGVQGQTAADYTCSKANN